MTRAGHASDVRSELRPIEKAALPIDSRARAAIRAALAILLVLLAIWVASDFLSALAWAAIIAITTWPIYTRFAALIAGGRAPAFAAGCGLRGSIAKPIVIATRFMDTLAPCSIW